MRLLSLSPTATASELNKEAYSNARKHLALFTKERFTISRDCLLRPERSKWLPATYNLLFELFILIFALPGKSVNTLICRYKERRINSQ